MEIITYSERVTRREYVRAFEWLDCPGAGFSFPADEHGNINMRELAPAAVDNVLRCLTSSQIEDHGVEVNEWSFTDPAVGRCACGAEVVLASSWANPCDRCSREYNMSGQQLAPRSQWGGEWATQPEEDYGLYEHDPF